MFLFLPRWGEDEGPHDDGFTHWMEFLARGSYGWKMRDLAHLCCGSVGALIVQRRTGCMYSNQVGGYACHQQIAEGELLVLSGPFERLLERFTDAPHHGWCSHNGDFTEEDAKFLDRFLAENVKKPLAPTVVDRSRLSEAQEAWVPVIFNGENAILTWENSD